MLPGCEAVRVQVPAAMKVAVVPETVQTEAVEDVKVTASPEVAVAVRVSGVPTFCAAMVGKVMVCVPGTTRVAAVETVRLPETPVMVRG